MKSTSAERTIEELRSIFSRFGLPTQLVSDNGPQLVSEEFRSFMEANGIQHIKSAPYHPATNGLAERFVQTMKQALKSSQGNGSLNRRLNTFLLTYRNTPHATTKVAPASAMMKRQLRTRLDLLRPPKTKQVVQTQQRAQVERRSKAKDRSFIAGERVLARNYCKGPKWIPATVVAQTGPVSYTVHTPENIIWRRHVDQLLPGTNLRDDSCQVTNQDQLLETYHDYELSPEHPLQQPTNVESAPDSPEPARVPTQGTVAPQSGHTPSPLRLRDNVTVDSPVRRHYPARERRPPDRLTI